MQRPPADDQQRAEREEGEVPGQRATEVVTHVMHTEELVVDDPLDEIEHAPTGEDQPEVERPAGGQPTATPVLTSAREPASTSSHVPTWKSPSANVFSSSPATVPVDCSWLSMWCHCRIWCSTMPSTKLAEPQAQQQAGHP